MMRSEFIERTKFEPTCDEYYEIEQEYMGCDVDKDQFCKQWLKAGGVQRLSRMRARRIEELEHDLHMEDRAKRRRIEELKNDNNELCRQLDEAQERIKRLMAQLETIKNAFDPVNI